MKQNLYLFSDTILRKKDNTLFIEKDNNSNTIHEADIDYKGEEVILVSPDKITGNGEKKFIPAQNVEAIYCFGSVKFNTYFLSMCSYYYIPVHVFSYYGTYLGSYMPKSEINSGNIVIKQVEYYNTSFLREQTCASLLRGAAENIKNNLIYYKYRGADLEKEIEEINEILTDFGEHYCDYQEWGDMIGSILGIEGTIRKIYYSSWKKFLKQDTGFNRRNRRPPEDMINCLISFGNTIMYSVCLNEIYRTGLLPSIGFLHTAGDNRFPLSFDLAEIFKPVIIDKVIFRVINLEMIKEDDFKTEKGRLIMKDKARRKFVEEIENRLKTVIMHPELKRGVSYRTLIRLECHKIIKHLKGNDGYKPFVSEV